MHCGKKVMNSIIRRPLNISFKSWLLLAPFGRPAAKSSRFKSWMKYSRRKNLHCFLKETMSFITYSASTKNELWTLFGLAQVRVKTSCFIPHTLVGQKLFSGKKIHTKYVKIYGAIVVIAVVPSVALQQKAVVLRAEWNIPGGKICIVFWKKRCPLLLTQLQRKTSCEHCLD